VNRSSRSASRRAGGASNGFGGGDEFHQHVDLSFAKLEELNARPRPPLPAHDRTQCELVVDSKGADEDTKARAEFEGPAPSGLEHCACDGHFRKEPRESFVATDVLVFHRQRLRARSEAFRIATSVVSHVLGFKLTARRSVKSKVPAQFRSKSTRIERPRV